ncbi:hypothetical protein ACIRG5_20260 [Lentzea sp. NPDC102401]|uniref:hypothetical protein n=1 Tax=Lentzea sp. NPDC102401 TaxID=3364128 RepID=UPI0038011591
MRVTRYVLGALAVVTGLALARDMAGAAAIPGTPTPLSVESMRVLADDGCKRPPGFRLNTLQMLNNSVLEVGVTDSQFVVCTVDPQSWGTSTAEVGRPGAEYFAGRLGLVGDDWTVELGRVGPEVAALEIVLPSGEIFKAELYGETYLCRLPHHVKVVHVRAYDAGGQLLRDADI